MATLLLTVAGGALGGPVGAAIGGLAGQAIDRNLFFRPKGREGPRLSDLSVQTSSYGTPIPRVFGTMRVAGSVIWSTDLIETRSQSSGGKGQPTVTSFSYAASFAVALSSRPVNGLGRIWADGNLLRGADGGFKVQTGFTLYNGGEDQPADPVIAAAEGIGLAPAHRGLAYVVFENLPLADFGNRIPSLTFEVIADPGPVATGTIVRELGEGHAGSLGTDTLLDGFSAYGDSARDVLSVLGDASDAWFAPDGDMLVMRNDRGATAVLADDGYAALTARGTPAGHRRVRSVAAIETVPLTLTVAHYDPARDFQTGLQTAQRPGAGNRRGRIDLPAAIGATPAKAVATAALASAEAARARRTIAAPWSVMRVAPGSPVTILGETGLWRVDNWSLEAMVLTLDLVRLSLPPGATQTATPGRVLSSPDIQIGDTVVHTFELPTLDDKLRVTPRILVAAAGSAPGWRRAALMVSTDGGNRFDRCGATAAPAVIGRLLAAPGRAAATLIDRTNVLDVELLHGVMTLQPMDASGLDSGGNLALVGDELMQFGTATMLGERRWRLGALRRGCRGTEAAIGTQRPGDRFVLIDSASVASIDLPLSVIGGAVLVLASGAADLTPASSEVRLTGASVRPLSPVQLAVHRLDDGIAISWARRSRLGWQWPDGIDVPLAEEAEQYSVTLLGQDGAIIGVEQVATPAIQLSARQLAGAAQVAVSQIGNAGPSQPSVIAVPR